MSVPTAGPTLLHVGTSKRHRGSADCAAADAAAQLLLDLPPAIVARLADEGVTTLEAWRALGRRRHRIFGITAVMVARIDKALAAALKGAPA